jgi:hypothetical protein
VPSKVDDRDPKLILAEKLGAFRYDPLGFVIFAFPWGEVGSRLEDETGPDVWQADILKGLGADLKAGALLKDAVGTAIKVAVASGHGIGKTALVAWIILWFQSCFPFNQTVVTANTKTQLLTKTWRELAKWHRLLINRDWFEWTATQFKHVKYPDSWFASAIPWSEHASEAFAGTHEKFVLIIFDEASLIADKIWEVTEGAMTTANAVWLCFGNPTRNTGSFKECFGRFKHRWRTWQIDSRTCKKANKKQIAQWVDDYGEDSDFVRVRVRGVFPRAGSMQLISGELVRQAMERTALHNDEHARVMGLDIARHGDDQSCTAMRQGLETWALRRYRIPDLMQLASKFCEDIDEFKPDGVFIDVTGMGWGVHDRLCQMRPTIPFYPIQVGERALLEKKHFNRRAELWWSMKEWLEAGGTLPPDKDGKMDVELEADLTGPEYGYDPKERVQLEKKEDMKERGLASPDSGDALALTFASTVTVKRKKTETWRKRLKELRHNTGATTPQSA